MKRKIRFFAISLVWAVISLAAVEPTLGQHSHDHSATEWKTGMLRLNKSAWIGDVRLKSGMYHVKHVAEGDKHWLVFKSVTLRAGYREGHMWEGKEIARLECRFEPVTKSLRNTKVTFGRTSDGEAWIQSIQIAGEKVTHILLPRHPAA
jgi:hypothetical protein